MSSWYDEKPNQEFRERVEHRAFQAIDNRMEKNESMTRRAGWLWMFQTGLKIGAGLSVATLVGILITRKNLLESKQEPSAKIADADFVSDALALDLLTEATREKDSQPLPLDFELFADLEMLENFDEILDLSEDDLSKDNV